MRLAAGWVKGRAVQRRDVWVFVVPIAAGCLGMPAAFDQGKYAPQRAFPTPKGAATALGAGYRRRDRKRVAATLGDKAWRLMFSADPGIDKQERAWFLSLYREGHAVVPDTCAALALGQAELLCPIPIGTRGTRWRFGPIEGHEDFLTRRISKTELSAKLTLHPDVAIRAGGEIGTMIRHPRRRHVQALHDEPVLRERALEQTEQGAVHLGLGQRRAGPASAAPHAGRQAGLDPNVWFDNVEVIAAEKIGREAVQYVSNISKYYLTYRMIKEQRAEREKAKGGVAQGTGM